MPRAPSGLSLLLMAGLAFAATSPPPQQLEFVTTKTTNTTTTTFSNRTSNHHRRSSSSSSSSSSSWPSTTSDLQSVADLWPVCNRAVAGDGPLCPPPCPANSTKSTQCLYYLQESHKEEVCGPDLGPERRRDVLHGLRMRHCCEHAVDAALPHQAFRGGNDCRRLLDDLLAVDELARRTSCSHHAILTRYDCGQTYSNSHHCSHCKEAYRRWVCSSLVPHFTRAGEHVRPCLSVCQDVEQQCPYLLPGDFTNQTILPGETHPTPQYAGEPTFLCLDPKIGETSKQRAKSLRGDEDCCYTHCGSPGRGGIGNGGGGGVLGVCEHCPGRPFINESSKAPSTSTTAEDVASAAAPALRAGVRTINKVSLLWTAWIIITLLIEHSQTIYNTLLQCLLVMCATSVRTTLLTTWTKKTKQCETCS